MALGGGCFVTPPAPSSGQSPELQRDTAGGRCVPWYIERSGNLREVPISLSSSVVLQWFFPVTVSSAKQAQSKITASSTPPVLLTMVVELVAPRSHTSTTCSGTAQSQHVQCSPIRSFNTIQSKLPVIQTHTQRDKVTGNYGITIPCRGIQST